MLKACRVRGGSRIDPARFEVVKNALISAAEEMKIVLAKTAYSPLLKVAGDYSCGIFDRVGNMVAQGPDLPIHLGSMPDAVRAVIAAFPESKPATCSSTTTRIMAARTCPMSMSSRRAFSASFSSGSAVCGRIGPISAVPRRAATARSPRSTARGCACRRCGSIATASPTLNIEAIIFANVRTPTSGGAICAPRSPPTAALRRGSQRSPNATAPTNLRDHGRGARLFRADDAGRAGAVAGRRGGFCRYLRRRRRTGARRDEDEPFTVRLTIRKQGDTITADFAGSDPAVPGPMNAPLTVTASGVYCALKMIADPKSLIPPNSGCWRPVTVTAPKGSVVDASRPRRSSTPITRYRTGSPTWSWRRWRRSRPTR